MTYATFDRWLLGAGGLVALLVVAVILTFLNTRQLYDDAGLFAHTHEVLDALAEVNGHLREAEAAQRTVLIVGGDAFPPEFAAGIDDARQKLRKVKALTEDNPAQQDSIPGIEKQIDALAAAWAHGITTRKEQGFEAARKLVEVGVGRKLLADLQRRLRDMDGVERALLRDRSAKTRGTYYTTLFTGLLLGVAAVAGVVAFAALWRRHLADRDAAARTIAEQGERLRTTLTSIGDAVIATDGDGRVTVLNPVAEALTGWAKEETAGRPLDDVFRIVNEETRQAVANPAARALSEGVVVGLANHTVLIAKDGTERPIDDSAAPIRCKDGEIVGCVLVFRDVSERRRLEKENAGRLRAAQLLAAIVESSNDAIISKSLDGIIQTWNAAAERLFGYTAAQAVGRHISLIIPPDRAAEEDRIIASMKAGQRIDHYDTVRLRSDGQPLAVSLTISPVKDEAGRVVGASKIARDVTERRRLEDHLQKLAADLAEGDRRKDEFLATLAHELRNPLAPLRNALQVIRLAPDLETRERARTMMERQLAQMVRLVDDLLDVSRITRGRLELRKARVQLAAVVAGAVETSRPLIDHMGHRLTVTLPPQPLTLDADLTRLAQVFSNLLNNSAKYMDRGGHIWLTAERQGGEVVVSVKDAGIGIAADQLPHVFEMFAQADRSLERAQGGLGIGLTLVKRLVELHGGAIEAKSAGPGRGAEFVVRLPVVADAAVPPAAGGPDGTSAPKAALRILIVDDSRDGADSLTLMLRMLGHATRTAYDGQEGVEAAEAFRPDVVLLDIGLPKLNGYEACRRLRERPWGKGVLIIALTGWGKEEDRRRSQEAGFDYHLVKPVDPQELLRLLAGPQLARP